MTPVSQPPLANAEEVVMPKPVDSPTELVERLELWCALREPLPTVSYKSVRELLTASLHYARAHATLTASNAALQREKAAAMGLVEGHALTVMKLERERDAAQARIAEMEAEAKRVARHVIRARAAIISGSLEETNHELYQIASPNFDSYTPWENLEALAGITTESVIASEWADRAPPSPPGAQP